MATVDDNFPDRSSTWPNPGSSSKAAFVVPAPDRCLLHPHPRLEQLEVAHIKDLQQPCQFCRYDNGKDA
jgi:hypothetical protein